MASNKRTRGLDQSTRDTLSSLEWALKQSFDAPKSDDEFTVMEYCEMLQKTGIQIKRRQASTRLEEMVAENKLTKRKINIDGSQTNLFRKV